MKKPRPICCDHIYVDVKGKVQIQGEIWLSKKGVKRLISFLNRYLIWEKK